MLTRPIGRLVSDFNGYFLDPPTTTRGEFQALLNRNAYVLIPVDNIHFANCSFRLYLFILFLARFTLAYINKVRDFPSWLQCNTVLTRLVRISHDRHSDVSRY